MSNMDYFGNRYRTFAKIFRSTKDPLSMTLGRRGDFNVPWISLVLAAVFVVFAYLNLPSNSEASQGVLLPVGRYGLILPSPIPLF